jgi:hypothetical protein
MTPNEAVRRAGGKQADLWRLFFNAAIANRIPQPPLSKQAVQQWVRRGHMPAARELQLMRLRPRWFRRSNGQGKVSEAKAVSRKKKAGPAVQPGRGAGQAGPAQRTNGRRSAL